MTPTRTDLFVPLTSALPASGERTEFHATVLTQPGEVQRFQSLANTAAPTSTASATPPAGNCQPQVTVQRDGNRVTGIRVQCSCGEVIELACTYEAAAPAPQPVAAAQPATMPQPEAAEPAPGKICKDSGKDLPTSASKKPKVPEKGRGTSAAKRSST
jgi:hypothetical protein